MEQNQTIDGIQFANMLRAGAAELSANVDEINDLNVFPIPDGDTGSNMLLTIMGGVNSLQGESADISLVSRNAANGMLLAARGNSGVILSQLFDGIAKGLEGEKTANAAGLANALRSGVCSAYSAVLKPTEGTILTVARCASENTERLSTDTPLSYMTSYINEAKKTLERTPDMLPVLKKAGVIDSGGAGLVLILEGMNKVLNGGKPLVADLPHIGSKAYDVDLEKFGKDSVLTFGYCTEVLLRLQSIKTDVDAFNVNIITDYLQALGDSVVAFKTDSIVKIHVHTMTPDKVLGFCRQYGEFLTVKIENMSLQHNSTIPEDAKVVEAEPAYKKRYGVVAALSGEGIKEMFCDFGVDYVVDGGQCMNPSAEDFIHAFSQVCAEHIFVLPNNGNVIMAAEQAARMYDKADIRVLPSKTIGEGHAALAIMNPDEPDADVVMQEMSEAMTGVVTAEISHCIRNAEMDGTELHIGDYIGVCGKNLLASSPNRLDACKETIALLGMNDYEICLLIVGADANEEEAELLADFVRSTYPRKEVYIVNGKQEVYDYIFVLQ